jgi:hypothetical protein
MSVANEYVADIKALVTEARASIEAATMAAEALARHGIAQSMDFTLLMNFLKNASEETDALIAAIAALGTATAAKTGTKIIQFYPD